MIPWSNICHTMQWIPAGMLLCFRTELRTFTAWPNFTSCDVSFPSLCHKIHVRDSKSKWKFKWFKQYFKKTFNSISKQRPLSRAALILTKGKKLKEFNIRRDDVEIKQHSVVTFLASVLDNNLSGKSMATKTLGKINGKLKFLYRKQNFLDSSLLSGCF